MDSDHLLNGVGSSSANDEGVNLNNIDMGGLDSANDGAPMMPKATEVPVHMSERRNSAEVAELERRRKVAADAAAPMPTGEEREMTYEEWKRSKKQENEAAEQTVIARTDTADQTVIMRETGETRRGSGDIAMQATSEDAQAKQDEVTRLIEGGLEEIANEDLNNTKASI